MIWITLIFSTLYFILIYIFYLRWYKYPILEENTGTDLKVSIIIPARNEADNIGALLHDLSLQDIPANKMEVIVVDDHSEDDTAVIAQRSNLPNLRLLYLQQYIFSGEAMNSYKKKALAVGIKAAKNEIIITTDADCRVGEKWVGTMIGYFKNEKYKIAAGPVVIHQEKNLLQYFQSLDLLGLMGITAATISQKNIGLCNGANLAFRKQAFQEVGGYDKIDQIASGDDMLLMKKILIKYPDSAVFVKKNEAVVRTLPAKNLQSLINQRIRWVSKVRVGNFMPATILLVAVYIFHLLILGLLFLSFYEINFIPLFLIALMSKIIPEYILIRSVAHTFRKEEAIRHFILSEFIHVIYVLIIGILGIFAQYEWKGRTIN